eukprot:1194810-Prorocentrum_minimum.AAC.10
MYMICYTTRRSSIGVPSALRGVVCTLAVTDTGGPVKKTSSVTHSRCSPVGELDIHQRGPPQHHALQPGAIQPRRVHVHRAGDDGALSGHVLDGHSVHEGGDGVLAAEGGDERHLVLGARAGHRLHLALDAAHGRLAPGGAHEALEVGRVRAVLPQVAVLVARTHVKHARHPCGRANRVSRGGIFPTRGPVERGEGGGRPLSSEPRSQQANGRASRGAMRDSALRNDEGTTSSRLHSATHLAFRIQKAIRRVVA